LHVALSSVVLDRLHRQQRRTSGDIKQDARRQSRGDPQMAGSPAISNAFLIKHIMFCNYAELNCWRPTIHFFGQVKID
jgi:hypothetical protein